MRRARNFSIPVHSRSLRSAASLAAAVLSAAVFLENTAKLASAEASKTVIGRCLSFSSLTEGAMSSGASCASSDSARCFVAALSLFREKVPLGPTRTSKSRAGCAQFQACSRQGWARGLYTELLYRTRDQLFFAGTEAPVLPRLRGLLVSNIFVFPRHLGGGRFLFRGPLTGLLRRAFRRAFGVKRLLGTLLRTGVRVCHLSYVSRVRP